jgi:hypothetical protein
MMDDSDRTIWYKLRYTPLRDVARGRLSARMDAQRPVEDSGLPPEVKQLLHRVLSKTRLWRLEQVQVAHELIAHFTDGIAAGHTTVELIGNFGDEKQAAKLIRRATRRNRPPAWQVARVAGWSLAALMLCYVGFAIYFFSGRPSIRVDYVAGINRAVEKTPLDDRAWPLYRRALLQLGPLSRRELTWQLDSKERLSLLNYVSEHQAELECIRQGAAKPSLGFLIGARGSANDRELWPDQRIQTVDPVYGEAVVSAGLPPLAYLRNLETLLRADAVQARQAHDGKRLSRDIQSILGLARQIGQDAPLLLGLVSASIREDLLDEIEQTLRNEANLLSLAEWTALSKQLSQPKVAADLITFQPERLWFDDLLQRSFTDDGSGNGRLTFQGVQYFDVGLHVNRDSWVRMVVHPALGLIVPSRQELARDYTQVLEIASANLKLPMRNADWSGVQDALDGSHKSFRDSISPISVARITPAYWLAQAAAERYLGRRDGIVVAIALELYHHDHGRYPDNLSALAPGLPEIPADRITGEPIRYRVVDGEPVVYSVGADRKDDGGRAANPPQIAARWQTDKPAAGDWILYPASK